MSFESRDDSRACNKTEEAAIGRKIQSVVFANSSNAVLLDDSAFTIVMCAEPVQSTNLPDKNLRKLGEPQALYKGGVGCKWCPPDNHDAAFNPSGPGGTTGGKTPGGLPVPIPGGRLRKMQDKPIQTSIVTNSMHALEARLADLADQILVQSPEILCLEGVTAEVSAILTPVASLNDTDINCVDPK